MKLVVDHDAGACSGVCRAISMIEKQLDKPQQLFSLGSVIHNRMELQRLETLGLNTLNQDTVEQSGDYEQFRDQNVFVRSHGISPALREKLLAVGAHIIDGTCPTVRRVQNEVMKYSSRGYQIVIVGKPDHPEVVALLGHCREKGIVIHEESDFMRIDISRPTLLVAQTTVAHEKFLDVKKKLLTQIGDLVVIDTTCRYIQKRQDSLLKFSQSVDVLLLIGGQSSSNTGVLYEISKRHNPRTHRIESEQDIQRNWFNDSDRVGITGSASTPLWQIENVYNFLKNLPLKGCS